MYSFNLCSQVQRCSTDEYRQNLKNKGILTEEQYEKAKDKILN